MSQPKKKTRNKHVERIDFLEEVIHNNGKAMNDVPKRKNYSLHDIKSIKPITEPQRQMTESWFSGNNLVATGSAGTGKSYLSLFLALNSILSKDENQDTLIIVRSAVPTRDIGFLPGSAEEKLEPYEAPYRDIINDLLGKNAYDNMKDNGKIKFIPTSFLRGLSWDNSIIFIDEIQSCTLHELSTVITRAGIDTRIIAVGDSLQNDLVYKANDKSGLAAFVRIAEKINEFDTVNFTRNDIVRSKLVKSWICAYEDEMNV